MRRGVGDEPTLILYAKLHQLIQHSETVGVT